VLPFSLTSAKRETDAYGLNKVGLERRGFDQVRLRAIQRAYRLLLAAKMNTTQALEKLKEEGIESEDVAYLVQFIENSERGVLK
jgi:UDP-N-acetylglucosamine acyltransferase